jgi:hypothetical protein
VALRVKISLLRPLRDTPAAIFFVVLRWVALMSGILSIYRELAGMYFPNAVPGKDMFWACTRMALFASLVLLWCREIKARKELEHPNEPPDSLRRRTVNLADEIEQFARSRHADRCLTINANPIDNSEFQRLTKAHDQETASMFAVKYHSSLMGIIQELKSKGVYWLEYDIAGNNWVQIREIQLLRSIAHRLDHKDDAIRLKYCLIDASQYGPCRVNYY